MPPLSQAQRTAMAIAEHEPDKLYKRNRGLLGMSHGQLHDFVSMPTAGLPKHKGGALSAAMRKRRQHDG